jgi:hypothetical protein
VARSQFDVESPLWWCERLYDELSGRQSHLKKLSDYQQGKHRFPWLPEQLSDLANRILAMTRTNYMGLVVDATTERLEVLGFRLGEDAPEADKEAWRVWQANLLDSLSSEAFLQAATLGTTYWLVAPDPNDAKTPKITVEHPAQMIVGYSPGDMRSRDAALKVWVDDRLDRLCATLYLPGFIFKYQGDKNSKPDKWERRLVAGEDWPAVNPYGDIVPVVEMRNNPQTIFDGNELRYTGVSEIEDVIDQQDRINKTIADRLVTQDFGMFPQKWATGWAEDDDEDTLQVATVIPGSGGQTTHPAGRVNFGRDRIVVANDPDVKFGEFSGASLDPYSTAKNEDVKDIAARTRTPSQYLLGEMVNISGEALQAAESGLVSKVRQRMRAFGEALEEMMRLALTNSPDNGAAGDKRTSTIWRDPEFRTMGQITDAVIKKTQAGLVGIDQALEDLGYTPTQITRIRAALMEDAKFKAEISKIAMGPQLEAQAAAAEQQAKLQAAQPAPNPGPGGNRPNSQTASSDRQANQARSQRGRR